MYNLKSSCLLFPRKSVKPMDNRRLFWDHWWGNVSSISSNFQSAVAMFNHQTLIFHGFIFFAYPRFSNLDGTNLHLVIPRGTSLAHPFALSIFENFVYMTDWNHRTVHRLNKLTGRNAMDYLETLQLPMDIHIYHPLRQDQSRALFITNQILNSHDCFI